MVTLAEPDLILKYGKLDIQINCLRQDGLCLGRLSITDGDGKVDLLGRKPSHLFKF